MFTICYKIRYREAEMNKFLLCTLSTLMFSLSFFANATPVEVSKADTSFSNSIDQDCPRYSNMDCGFEHATELTLNKYSSTLSAPYRWNAYLKFTLDAAQPPKHLWFVVHHRQSASTALHLTAKFGEHPSYSFNGEQAKKVKKNDCNTVWQGQDENDSSFGTSVCEVNIKQSKGIQNGTYYAIVYYPIGAVSDTEATVKVTDINPNSPVTPYSLTEMK